MQQLYNSSVDGPIAITFGRLLRTETDLKGVCWNTWVAVGGPLVVWAVIVREAKLFGDHRAVDTRCTFNVTSEWA